MGTFLNEQDNQRVRNKCFLTDSVPIDIFCSFSFSFLQSKTLHINTEREVDDRADFKVRRPGG